MITIDIFPISGYTIGYMCAILRTGKGSMLVSVVNSRFTICLTICSVTTATICHTAFNFSSGCDRRDTEWNTKRTRDMAR